MSLFWRFSLKEETCSYESGMEPKNLMVRFKGGKNLHRSFQDVDTKQFKLNPQFIKLKDLLRK